MLYYIDRVPRRGHRYSAIPPKHLIYGRTRPLRFGGINRKNDTSNWEGKNERSLRPLGRVMRWVDGYEGRVSDLMSDGGLMVVRWDM